MRKTVWLSVLATVMAIALIACAGTSTTTRYYHSSSSDTGSKASTSGSSSYSYSYTISEDESSGAASITGIGSSVATTTGETEVRVVHEEDGEGDFTILRSDGSTRTYRYPSNGKTYVLDEEGNLVPMEGEMLVPRAPFPRGSTYRYFDEDNPPSGWTNGRDFFNQLDSRSTLARPFSRARGQYLEQLYGEDTGRSGEFPTRELFVFPRPSDPSGEPIRGGLTHYTPPPPPALHGGARK